MKKNRRHFALSSQHFRAKPIFWNWKLYRCDKNRVKESTFHQGSLPGTLFIVGVPIGHPDDLTIRALATFRHVGLVATKNPRATQALLAHHGIHTTLTTYDRVNAAEKVPILLGRLKQGTHIALVSDCGMPLVYDPGRLLIKAATHVTHSYRGHSGDFCSRDCSGCGRDGWQCLRLRRPFVR